MVVEDVFVDYNLLYLNNVLFSLDSWQFDCDILKLLNELKTLVDKKMFFNFNLNNFDVEEQKVILRYYLKEDKK